MAIFVTDKHKGCVIGRGYTVISSFETAEEFPKGKRMGTCLAKRGDLYGVILYDPDDLENESTISFTDWGTELEMWNFYWRRVVGHILNGWNRAQEKVQNERTSRDETLQH